MKKVAGSLLGLLLALLPGSAFAENADWTVRGLSSMLKSNGYAVTEVDKETLSIKVDGTTYALTLFGGDLQMYYGAQLDRGVSLNDINTWNKDHRNSRAYIRDLKTNAYALEADMLAEGASPAAVKRFVKMFIGQSAPAFKKYLIEH